MALLRFEPDLCLYVNTFLSVVVLEMINRNGFCLKSHSCHYNSKKIIDQSLGGDGSMVSLRFYVKLDHNLLVTRLTPAKLHFSFHRWWKWNVYPKNFKSWVLLGTSMTISTSYNQYVLHHRYLHSFTLIANKTLNIYFVTCIPIIFC